jgi:hypothetical protein
LGLNYRNWSGQSFNGSARIELKKMQLFRNYIYVSPNKIEQCLAQMPPGVLSKLTSETKVKMPGFEQTVKADFEIKESHFRALDAIVEEVERRGLIGDFLDYKPWFRARLQVRALLSGWAGNKKVFYVGSIRNADIVPVDFAMQCSLNNHIGIENHRSELERLSTGNMPQTLRLSRLAITLPSVTSSNYMFAADLGAASSLVDESETKLLSQRILELEPRQFFRSKEDHKLHELYKPSDRDQYVLEEYSSTNSELLLMMTGSFTPLRRGLIDPPKWSLVQTFRNLIQYRPLAKRFGAKLINEKVDALRKIWNFQKISKRATTDPESKVLNSIMSIAHGTAETSIEVVGIRLLDGYYRRQGYSSERRVILGSPLYMV